MTPGAWMKVLLLAIAITLAGGLVYSYNKALNMAIKERNKRVEVERALEDTKIQLEDQRARYKRLDETLKRKGSHDSAIRDRVVREEREQLARISGETRAWLADPLPADLTDELCRHRAARLGQPVQTVCGVDRTGGD